MPPGRHSSSSHHSSHSHSSSHRSSHSSSSHSSRSYSSSSYSRSSSTSSYYQPARTRRNQPTGYNKNMPGYKAPKTYYRKNHDYRYYASDWTDSSTGAFYRKGYYDENGKYYTQLVTKTGNSLSTQFDCEYCGTGLKLNWTEGAIPQCPNCGANLKEVLEGAAIDSITSFAGPSAQKNSSGKRVTATALGVVGGTIGLIVLGAMSGLSSDSSSHTSDSAAKKANVDIWGESFYVEAIDREISWNDEYDSYYDKESDCYVYYNVDQDPPVWQYWYEDISSDYGDYGWMEYELDEDTWYIEVDDDDWEKLPKKYDASKLWYFTGEQSGTSYAGLDNTYLFTETIAVDGYVFNWRELAQSYYNEELDCYIWYNTDVDPHIWQYYYKSISGLDEFKGHGWMEYDKDSRKWYIDTEDGWEKLPAKYHGSSLWHMDGSPTPYVEDDED